MSAAGKVDDVTIVPHSGSQLNDKLKVEYVDGTDKEENIPFDPAIDDIQRKWKTTSGRKHEYLSCSFNRGNGNVSVPFDVRISSIGHNNTVYFNDASRFMISSYNDTNLEVG